MQHWSAALLALLAANHSDKQAFVVLLDSKHSYHPNRGIHLPCSIFHSQSFKREAKQCSVTQAGPLRASKIVGQTLLPLCDGEGLLCLKINLACKNINGMGI